MISYLTLKRGITPINLTEFVIYVQQNFANIDIVCLITTFIGYRCILHYNNTNIKKLCYMILFVVISIVGIIFTMFQTVTVNDNNEIIISVWTFITIFGIFILTIVVSIFVGGVLLSNDV